MITPFRIYFSHAQRACTSYQRARVKLLNVEAKDNNGSDVFAKETQRIMMQLSERPMSLKELVETTGIEEKRVYRVLSSLHKGGQIIHVRDDDNMRRYRPVEKSR